MKLRTKSISFIRFFFFLSVSLYWDRSRIVVVLVYVVHDVDVVLIVRFDLLVSVCVCQSCAVCVCVCVCVWTIGPPVHSQRSLFSLLGTTKHSGYRACPLTAFHQASTIMFDGTAGDAAAAVADVFCIADDGSLFSPCGSFVPASSSSSPPDD